ncbi:hypothetical protein M569_13678 [Genlisea aurea]|uniref:Uncharacterized protein n=1 Tax=Genlisea aurea TaxID=192259 RepID=S8C2T7_9LAMI|nr:hypothetical protein M569_13678 [Genlisea aurea]
MASRWCYQSCPPNHCRCVAVYLPRCYRSCPPNACRCAAAADSGALNPKLIGIGSLSNGNSFSTYAASPPSRSHRRRH